MIRAGREGCTPRRLEQSYDREADEGRVLCEGEPGEIIS